MSRQPRKEFPGAHYHVMSRGNEKQDVFRSRGDRTRFLGLLEEVVSLDGWELFAFCLLSNHYHLVVHTPAPTLAHGMRYLNGVYTQWFNAKYNRVGHLFQGRYFSRSIQRDEHVLALTRYIAQNPLRAGLCDEVSNWEWGSHRAIAGLSPCPGFLNADLFLSLFGDEPHSARQAYVEYVGMPAQAESWMKFSRGKRKRSAVDSTGDADRLCRILKTRSDKKVRNLEILDAYQNHGYSMDDIACVLGLTRMRVNQIILAELRIFG